MYYQLDERPKLHQNEIATAKAAQDLQPVKIFINSNQNILSGAREQSDAYKL
jgi:hypothetical protein